MHSLNFDLNNNDPWKLTFHLPLHRYLSVFAYNAIYKYNIDPALFLPIDNQNTLLNLMFYPLRTIVSEDKILNIISLLFSVDIMKFYRIFGFEMVNKL
jgi:hypothetical protein